MERPIDCAAHEVTTALNGTRTQMRRPVTVSNSFVDGTRPTFWGQLDLGAASVYVDRGPSPVGNPGPYLHVPRTFAPPGFDPTSVHRVYPRVAVGDRLWVRETWQPLWAPGRETAPASLASPEGWRISYVATDGVQEYHDPDDGLVDRCKSSLHMPRWASRLTLVVTAIRVERVQSISEADARAEGCECRSDLAWDDGLAAHATLGVDPYAAAVARGHRAAFAARWDASNKRAPWASNPWVWVIDFIREREPPGTLAEAARRAAARVGGPAAAALMALADELEALHARTVAP